VRVTFTSQPAYTAAYVELAYGESILLERGALAAMDKHVQVSVGIGSGGVVKAGLRKAFGQESFFMGKYQATADGAWVMVAPQYPGDIAALIGCEESIDIDVHASSIAHIALGEGLAMLKASGQGIVLIASYGGIEKIELEQGQVVIVDTGHLVATTASCSMRVGLLGNVITAEATGEGIVAEVSGPGTLWMQTRAESGIRNWLFPQRKQNTGQ
jgi:uncharacterized protein (TIGR00266 family)